MSRATFELALKVRLELLHSPAALAPDRPVLPVLARLAPGLRPEPADLLEALLARFAGRPYTKNPIYIDNYPLTLTITIKVCQTNHPINSQGTPL